MSALSASVKDTLNKQNIFWNVYKKNDMLCLAHIDSNMFTIFTGKNSPSL